MTSIPEQLTSVDWWIEQLWHLQALSADYERLGYEHRNDLDTALVTVEGVIASLWAATEASITCPVCGRTSYNPNDIANGYCGLCHWWTSDPILSATSTSDRQASSRGR